MACHSLAVALFLAAAAPLQYAPSPIRSTVPSADAEPSRGLSRRPARPSPGGLAPVPGDTLTTNPAAYRVWLRRKIDEDLAELYKVTTDLIKLLDPAAPGDPKKAVKQAERVVKLSHNVWSNVQMRRPTRERPKEDRDAKPRDLAASRSDAEVARDLVREIAAGIADEQRSRDLDASLRVTTLEKLERVERIGLRLKTDLATNQRR